LAYETPIPINYVTKDYEGFLQMMRELVPTLLPEWTDLSESDFGNVLLQLAAYGLHVLSFYQDKIANENFLVTAKNRKSIINLCKFLGYTLSPQVASTVEVTFTKFADKLNEEIIIPKGTQVSTDPSLGDQIIFETDVDLVISSGVLSASVTATQGESFTGEAIGVGNNIANQEIVMERESILENSLIIYTVENGVKYTWEKVDDFLKSTSTDRHFTANLDENNLMHLKFGNGVLGRRVATGVPIYADYRVGGGKIGNVGVNKIVYINSVNVRGIETVTNLVPATGGMDYEDIEHARILAPKWYNTMDRAVTASDFETLAKKVPGVVNAVLEETFNTNNDLNLYIAPTDYGEASEELKNAVRNKIRPIMLLNNTLNIYSANYVRYNVFVDVTISSNYANDIKKNEIETLLTNILSPIYFNFGESIPLSYVVGHIMKAIAGVKKVSVDAIILGATPTPIEDEIICGRYELLIPSEIVVNVTGGGV